jgi:hypothetical protein
MDSIVFIDVNKYWALALNCCEEMSEDLWWYSTDDELNELFFGLKEVLDFNLEKNNPNLKCFEVVDPKKYVWAKLKYNI